MNTAKQTSLSLAASLLISNLCFAQDQHQELPDSQNRLDQERQYELTEDTRALEGSADQEAAAPRLRFELREDAFDLELQHRQDQGSAVIVLVFSMNADTFDFEGDQVLSDGRMFAAGVSDDGGAYNYTNFVDHIPDADVWVQALVIDDEGTVKASAVLHIGRDADRAPQVIEDRDVGSQYIPEPRAPGLGFQEREEASELQNR